ncbi:MAG: hypothetical protein WBL81_06955, partial [Pseudolabrys sp.]
QVGNGAPVVPTVSNPPRLTFPTSVISVRAQAYSPDDQTVVISLTTKYSTAERTYSVPLGCLDDLVVDLQRLNALDAVF